ncbi:hypothetical protein [Duganella sp. FT27W]|uniref:hypothetical protein n=1 Tax=Duganella sp. FT27W TaxID=2654636 RepID=UPI00128C5974|nr:hypothetical protein [Duganella sp. FT27W]MPQ56673.1 hypothetical protein [Duganella sp. FT27W]
MKKSDIDKYKIKSIEGLTDPENLFLLSNAVSKKCTDEFLELSKNTKNAIKKVDSVRNLKKIEKDIYAANGIFEALKSDFHVDGAIKINGNELHEFKEFVKTSGLLGTIKNDSEISEYSLSEYLLRFGYLSGGNFIFRGNNYYFLLDGLDIEETDPLTSINDFVISDVRINDLIDSICIQYNSIKNQFKIYGSYVIKIFHSELTKRKLDFCEAVKIALSEKRFEEIRKVIQSGKFGTGHTPTDEIFYTQWEEALVELEQFKKFIEDYEKSDDVKKFIPIAQFIASRASLFLHCKIVFAIDIDFIIKSHFKMEIPKVVKKIILGLIDAKINIIAFSQNIFQILTNVNFLDPEYPGSLIFERDIVRNIKNTCPKEFSDFKQSQKFYVDYSQNGDLLGELDEDVAMFVNILLLNDSTSYIRLAEFGTKNNGINEVGDNSMPELLRSSMEITRDFFNLLQNFLIKSELTNKNKKIKKEKKGLGYIDDDRHIKIKKQALKRIIRLYREENNPLVMIKTAQNALNFVLARGYEPKKDVLHVMSVNYGGALTGFFAKQVFLCSSSSGKVLANTGSLIYSLYDVKNANSFARLTGYPFSQIILDNTIDKNTKENFSKKNWLLIFDDNTNSGETLDNIRILAKETEYFGRIDMFPCRASFNLDNYKITLNDHQKLAMIVSSALEVRRAKVNPKGLRYKELLGTIVGNRLWKIRNKKLPKS